MRFAFGIVAFTAILSITFQGVNSLDHPTIPIVENVAACSDGNDAFQPLNGAAGTLVLSGGQDDKELSNLLSDLGSSDYRLREKAAKRLLEIGIPALEALDQAADKSDLEIRSRSASLANQIRAGDLITVAKSMLFKLIVPKELALPKAGTKNAKDVILEFTNLSKTACRVRLAGAVVPLFGDSKQIKTLEDTKFRVSEAIHPRVSPALEKDQSYRLILRASLTSAENGQPLFRLLTPFGEPYLSSLTIKKQNTYRFGLVYDNRQPVDEHGDALWVGKVQTQLATFVVK